MYMSVDICEYSEESVRIVRTNNLNQSRLNLNKDAAKSLYKQ